MSNLQELQTQLRDLNVQLAEAKSTAKRTLLEAVKDQAQELGITQDELLIDAGFKKARRARALANSSSSLEPQREPRSSLRLARNWRAIK